MELSSYVFYVIFHFHLLVIFYIFLFLGIITGGMRLMSVSHVPVSPTLVQPGFLLSHRSVHLYPGSIRVLNCMYSLQQISHALMSYV